MSDTNNNPTSALVRTAGRLPLANMADFSQASELLAKAGFLGCKNAGEAFMVAASAHQRGEDLVSFQQKFHLRQGRFSMTAHAVLDEFLRRGGSMSKVIRTPDRASVTLKKDSNTYVSALTWEEAQEEPFIYKGNETEQMKVLDLPAKERLKHIKPKYATPRSRAQMLWARVISDGVATLDPGARLAYTPEEVGDFSTAEDEIVPEEIVVSAEEIEIDVIPPPQKDAGAPKKPVEGKDTPEPDASAPASSGEPTVAFPMKDEEAEAPVDYKVAPYGEKAGTPWAKMPLRWLHSALKVTDPRMTDLHKAEIELAISTRNKDYSK